MCRFFGVSRAAFYAWQKRIGTPDRDINKMAEVIKVYQASHRTYGYRRITIALQKQQQINHKAVLRLMHKLGIRSVARKRKIYKQLSSTEGTYQYSNLLDRNFTATRPNQKWVTDVTYIHTQQGLAYLSTIKDLFDGFIVAHQLGRENSVGLVTNTIRLAQRKEKIVAGLILHSDQGFQYRTHPYRLLTSTAGITPSMSRRGNCWDNAPMENFFGHLKEEALRQFKNPSFHEAQQIIDDYIYFFNFERIQLKTRLTPYQLRCQST